MSKFTIMPTLLFVILSVCCLSQVQAQSDDWLSGGWYRIIDGQASKQAPNAHYNAEVFGFSAPGSDRQIPSKAFTALIHPNINYRTLIRLGTVEAAKSDNPADITSSASLKTAPAASAWLSIPLKFLQTEIAEGKLRERPEGWLSPSYLNILGLRRENAEFTWNVSVPASAKSLQPGERPDSIRINGTEYQSLNAAFLRLANTAPNEAVAKEFLRLMFLHIFLIETRIKEFGTTAMIDKKETIPALSKGALYYEFQARGFFGLGNSGVMFKIRDSGEFPGIFINGDIFGGVYEMEGTLSLAVESPKGRIKVGSIDCRQVKLKDGLANEGIFIVRMEGPAAESLPLLARSFPVSIKELGQ